MKTQNIANELTGLVQIALPIAGHYAIGFRPDRSLLCIGSFNTDGLYDVFSENETVYIRMNNNKPVQFFPETDYMVKNDEVKISIGNYFVLPGKEVEV